MKSINEDEMEIAVRLLLRIFQIDPRMKIHFSLSNIPDSELRHNVIFVRHVKVNTKIISFLIQKIFRHLSLP